MELWVMIGQLLHLKLDNLCSLVCFHKVFHIFPYNELKFCEKYKQVCHVILGEHYKAGIIIAILLKG